MKKSSSDRETKPSDFGNNVYLIPIISDTSVAQELATLKITLKRKITAMVVLPGGSLLVDFAFTEEK